MPTRIYQPPHDDRLALTRPRPYSPIVQPRRSQGYLLALERDRRARINTATALIIASLLTALAGLLLALSVIAA